MCHVGEKAVETTVVLRQIEERRKHETDEPAGRGWYQSAMRASIAKHSEFVDEGRWLRWTERLHKQSVSEASWIPLPQPLHNPDAKQERRMRLVSK